MTTGAITDSVVYATREQVAPTMSQESALELLLTGHEAGAFKLPDGLLKADGGHRALVAAVAANYAERSNRFPSGWMGAEASRLVAEYLRLATTTGALPKLDAGAKLAAMKAEADRLEDDSRIYAEAAEKAQAYPIYAVRGSAGAIHKALDAALAEILKDAKPYSAAVSRVTSEVSAVRVDRAGYDILDGLVERLGHIEEAGQAMAALGVPWAGADRVAGDGPAVIRLAVAAAA
jgi:hypothetical protein